MPELSDSLFLYALLGGVGISLMAGPLGCFIVWRRMAYFGDTVAHASLLGVVFALLSGIGVSAGMLIVAIVLALLLGFMRRGHKLPIDTLLGIFAHGALALALVLIALFDIRVDVNAFLFGDVLAVTASDLVLIYIASAVVCSSLAFFWRKLMMVTLHEDIAAAEGINTQHMRLSLMLLIAASVAVSIKIVGMLLITSLLIIPAATARNFARTPSQMAGIAVLAGALSVMLGLALSFAADTPSGPSIILAALGLFLGSLVRRTAKGNF